MEYLIFSTLRIRYLKIHFTNKRNKIRRLCTMESSCNGDMQKPEFYTGFKTSNSFTACEFLQTKEMEMGGERGNGICICYLI